MRDTQPAPASQHPFPIRREERQTEARTNVVCALICLIGAIHFIGQLRDLIDQADDDVARAARIGHGCKHGPKLGKRARSE